MNRLIVDVRVEVPGFSVEAQFSAGTGITVLSGPSGSGKSLTLAAIAGTIRPAHGTVAYDGQVFVDTHAGVHMRSQDRRLGMVYQQAALLDHRSPLDNVSLAIRNGDKALRKKVAQSVLERVGVAHLANAQTRLLSGGERQRIALARAIAGNPQILLMDEPFSSLDATTREQMRLLVRTLVDERQITALLVTHDAQDVHALAHSVVQYEPGRTVSASE